MEGAHQQAAPVNHFRPGRMIYEFELNPWQYDSIPTTLIQSQQDLPSNEDKVSGMVDTMIARRISKIITLMHHGSGKKSKKKKKKKRRSEGSNAMVVQDEEGELDISQAMPLPEDDIFGDDDVSAQKGVSLHEADLSSTSSRQYFSSNDPQPKNVPTPSQPVQEEHPEIKKTRQREKAKERSAMETDDYLAELYPSEYSYAIEDDSDEDLSKMDQGRRGAKARPWDFETEKEWENYNTKKEAMPKAAFQFGLKMKDGRNTKRLNKQYKATSDNPERRAHIEQQKFEREFQAIQKIIQRRQDANPKRSKKSAPSRKVPATKRQKILLQR